MARARERMESDAVPGLTSRACKPEKAFVRELVTTQSIVGTWSTTAGAPLERQRSLDCFWMARFDQARVKASFLAPLPIRFVPEARMCSRSRSPRSHNTARTRRRYSAGSGRYSRTSPSVCPRHAAPRSNVCSRAGNVRSSAPRSAAKQRAAIARASATRCRGADASYQPEFWRWPPAATKPQST